MRGLFLARSVHAGITGAVFVFGDPFFLATAIGAKYFHGASDVLYRRIAYAIIALAALVSLPVFDGFLR